MHRILILYLALFPAFSAPIAQSSEEPITFESLLLEMIERESLVRFPDPPYTAGQFSSYDRKSIENGKDGWFANEDWSNFLRKEEDRGRPEWVLMDAKGPGCVTRIWATAQKPQGIIRIYIDGGPDPVIQAPTAELLGGTALVGPPLAATRARGLNFYLPIPYAGSCKITYEGPDYELARNREDRFWYNIGFRTWPEGTPLESFTGEDFEEARPVMERVREKLLESPAPSLLQEGSDASLSHTLKPGKKFGRAIAGPAAIRELSLRLEADDLPSALRQTVLVLNCDDAMTVWCPVGDFFGTGPGLNPFHDWWRTVEANGRMTCRWIMPFEKICRIEVWNGSANIVKVELETAQMPWTWDDRSMHFHTNWRRQAALDTGVKRDWPYVMIKGKGVLVGDTLAVINPTKAWWGEGDEKIRVDGEEFPSIFGTGTEDKYGYAFGTPERFEAPFHSQPRADGPDSFGHIMNTRTRSLDAIPFSTSLDFLMEVWHWERVQLDFTAATYWYGFPGAMGRPNPDIRMMRCPVPEIEYPYRIKGVIEGESLAVLETKGGSVGPQEDTRFGWSGNAVLHWKGAEPDDSIVLSFPVKKSGLYTVQFNMSRNFNRGAFQFSLNGVKLEKTIDLFTPAPMMTGDVNILTTQLAEGDNQLKVTLTGANKMTRDDKIFALDYIKLISRD